MYMHMYMYTLRLLKSLETPVYIKSTSKITVYRYYSLYKVFFFLLFIRYTCDYKKNVFFFYYFFFFKTKSFGSKHVKLFYIKYEIIIYSVQYILLLFFYYVFIY